MSAPGITKLINMVPEPVLGLLVNAQGFVYRRNRYSSRMRRTLAEWRLLEGLDAEALDAYQLGRLRHVVRAAALTPYYSRVFREVGFDPEVVTSADDLRRLPVLEKAALAQHSDEMLVPGYEGRVLRRRSSGTTGQPVAYSQPHRMAFDQTFAMLYQFYGWHGFEPLGRRATMAGRYLGHRPGGVVVRNWFENQLLLGVHSLSEQSVARYLKALDAFRPEILQAHPSALLLLKQLAEAANLRPPDLPLITFTAESLSETERRCLSEWLGGAVIFGTYGSGENVVAAGECSAIAGYHIHPAVGICELVEIDSRSEIVSTSLLNDAMPLLRYRTGDFALSISDSPCPCGCTWARLTGIQGRVDDIIHSSDGNPIAPVVLRTGIAAQGLLKSPYSIIQHKTTNHYTLLLYCQPDDETPDRLDAVLSYLKSILGQQCRIAVSFTSRDEMLTARAKHRIVVKERN